MDFGAAGDFRGDDLFFLVITIAVAAGVSLAVFAACYYWFKREHNRMQKRILDAVGGERDPDSLFLTGRDAALHGELVAQFKVNQGKQVVSLLESDGKRFLHVDGTLSAPERAKMVRYLKSEGFMS